MALMRTAAPSVLAFLAALLPAQTRLDAEFVDRLADRAFEKFAPVGFAVAIVQDGTVLGMAARGQRVAGTPMTPQSLFNIASCSKAFTAASIALLVQEKKLGWDDRVVDHVPEFRLSDPWITAHMTIRDLLSHRCGLATFAGDLLWYDSDYDDAEVVRRLEKLPITQPFRGQFGYQNLMYLVAGLVIARTSGEPWEDFVQHRFLSPLGMAHTAPCAARLPAGAEKAIPHIGGAAIPDHEYHACKPAAAIYSSVDELTAWMRMLLAGGEWNGATILSQASLQEMWKPHVGIGAGSGADTRDFRSYGMGWFLAVERGKKLVEHDGGMPGFLSKVSLMPAENFGFVVLNNSDDGVLNEGVKRAVLAARAGDDAMAVIDRVAVIKKRVDQGKAAEVKKREAARVADTHATLPLEDYVGRFDDAIYGPAEVALENGELHLVLVPGKRRMFGVMHHWHFDTFRVDFPDTFLPFALIRFDFDFEGKVAGFRIDCPIADFDFGALDFRKAR